MARGDAWCAAPFWTAMDVPRLGAVPGRRGGGVVVRGGALIARPPRPLAEPLGGGGLLLGGGVPLPPLGLGGPPGGVLLSLLPRCVVAVFLAR